MEKEKALDPGTLFLTRNVSQINDCEITKLFRNEPPRRMHPGAWRAYRGDGTGYQLHASIVSFTISKGENISDEWKYSLFFRTVLLENLREKFDYSTRKILSLASARVFVYLLPFRTAFVYLYVCAARRAALSTPSD